MYAHLAALFFALLMLSGCGSHPNDGDIYENLLTQERIEVMSTGVCSEIYSGFHDVWESLVKNENTPSGMMQVPRPEYAARVDTTQTCFAYAKSQPLGEYGTGTLIILNNVSDLDRSWKLIN